MGDMNIGKDGKFDLTQVSIDGLTAEDIENLNKKAKKLIDIYNTDGQKGLSQVELARAMDGFSKAAGEDGILSDDELEKYANTLNKDRKVEQQVEVKDLKSFLRSLKRVTKNAEKQETSSVIQADNERILDEQISKGAISLGYNPLDGHERTFVDADGRVLTFVQTDEEGHGMLLRAKEIDGKYVMMSGDEIYAQDAQIYAEKNGFHELEPDSGVYALDSSDEYVDPSNKYLYNSETGEMVRVKPGENNEWVPMSAEEIAAADAAYKEQVDGQKAEAVEKKRVEALNNYVVQPDESISAIVRKSLAAQGVTSPSDAEFQEALALFKKDNAGKIKKTKSGYEYLLVGANVKIAGKVEGGLSSQEAIEKWAEDHSDLVLKGKANGDLTEAEKTKGDALATEKGYRTTHCSGIYYDESKDQHYKYNSATGMLEKFEAIEVCKDGSYVGSSKPITSATTKQTGYEYIIYDKNGEKIRKRKEYKDGKVAETYYENGVRTGWAVQKPDGSISQVQLVDGLKKRRQIDTDSSGNKSITMFEYNADGTYTAWRVDEKDNPIGEVFYYTKDGKSITKEEFNGSYQTQQIETKYGNYVQYTDSNGKVVARKNNSTYYALSRSQHDAPQMKAGYSGNGTSIKAAVVAYNNQVWKKNYLENFKKVYGPVAHHELCRALGL